MKNKLNQLLTNTGLTGKAEPAGKLWRIRITEGGKVPTFGASLSTGNEQELTDFVGRMLRFRDCWLAHFGQIKSLWYREETSPDGHIYITVGSALADVSSRNFSASPTDSDIHEMLKTVENGGME